MITLAIYNRFQIYEMEENRYYMGLQFGREISDLELMKDWIENYSTDFRRKFDSRVEIIEKAVESEGLENILLSKVRVHQLLGDE